MHDFLAGRGRAGKDHLADPRVGGHLRPQAAVAGDDIEHTRGQDFIHDLRHAQSRQGGVFRRLDHHGIAAAQRRHGVPHGDHHREVPRRDRTHHSQRFAVHLDTGLVVVLDNVYRQFQFRGGAAPGHGAAHLEVGAHAAETALGFTLLQGQQLRQLAAGRLQGIGDGVQQALALTVRGQAPGREGPLGGGHRLVDMLRRGLRALRRDFFGRRVQHREGLTGADRLAVYDQVVFRHGFLHGARGAGTCVSV
jgi:hypothetical protein